MADRGRGRPVGQRRRVGRGRGRGRGREERVQPAAIAPADLSGEDDEIDHQSLARLANIAADGDDMTPFPIEPRGEGSSDDESEDGTGEAGGEEPPAAAAMEADDKIPIYARVENDVLGDQDAREYFDHSPTE